MAATRPMVVVTREVTGVVDVPGAEVRMGRDTPRLGREELLAFVKGASVVVSMYHDQVDAEFLDAAGPGLKGVCNYAVGYENIDVPLCTRRGVVVTNTPDAVTEGTANMAVALMLAVARRVAEGDRFVRSGAYAASGGLSMAALLGMHLTGQTLLIVGAGRIGRAVALRALAFGMRVVYAARTRHMDFELAPIAGRRVELDEGLALADVVSIHAPLTDQTRHLIDARRLGLMKRTAILVNTARGPIVQEEALVEALGAGRIWGAGLDVYEFEPRVAKGLIGLENVVLTPHVGSGERRYRELMTEMVSANARAILAGRPAPNAVGG